MTDNYFYASINAENVCDGIAGYEKELSAEFVPDNYMSIPSHDISILGKKLNGEVWEFVQETVDAEARSWRDEELVSTDSIVPATDHPKHAEYLTYRAALRDWPSTADFPDTRPVL